MQGADQSQASAEAATVADRIHAFCAGESFNYNTDLSQIAFEASSLAGNLARGSYTTVICACDPEMPLFLDADMDVEHYLPELVDTGILDGDRDYIVQHEDQNAAAHTIGVSPSPTEVPTAETPGYQAYKSVDPTGTPAVLVNDIYEQLEQMAIGLEMAGPDLTPSAFGRGMSAYPTSTGPLGPGPSGPTSTHSPTTRARSAGTPPPPHRSTG